MISHAMIGEEYMCFITLIFIFTIGLFVQWSTEWTFNF